MSQLLQANQVIAGYEIEELVGRGGMGEVYRARQVSMHRIVALKVLSERLAKRDPSFAKKFVDEARAAGRLNHPNIIAVHDVGKTDLAHADGSSEEVYYFSMEYVDGETIKQIIKRSGTCKLDLIKQVMDGMAEALVYAESMHVVHRDIKPDNIMISTAGAVKLADLGLAQNTNEVVGEERDAAGRRRVMGTPLYMSPEQARALPVDHRSDQYSLGATLYHMLTGQPPFAGASSKEIMRAHVMDPVPEPEGDFPEAWRQICVKLMAKDPADRFASAQAMRSAIKLAIAGNAGIGQSRRGRSIRVHATESTDKRLSKFVIAAAILVAAGIAWFILSREDKPAVVAESTEPQRQKTEPDGVRVEEAIRNLPADHEQAIALLQKYLADPRANDDRSRMLLSQEIERRKTELEEQRRHENEQQQSGLQAKADAIAQLIAAGRYDRAAKSVADLNDAQKQDPALAGMEKKIQAAIDADRSRIMGDIANAAALADLDKAADHLAGRELPNDLRDQLTQAIQARRDDIARKASAEQNKGRWQRLAQALEACRFTSNYAELADAVAQEAEQFNDPDKSTVLQLAKLAEFAKKGEQFLRNQVRSAKPSLKIPSLALAEVTLIDINDEDVVYKTSDADTRNEPRCNILLPAVELIARSLSSAPADVKSQGDVISASYLWFWNPEEAREKFAKIDDPLAQAVMMLDQQPRVAVHAPAKLDGARLTVEYDFTRRNPLHLQDFSGERIGYGAKGLHWETDQTTAKDNRKESDLATASWEPSLRPPFKVESTIWLARHVKAVLVGVKSGDGALRLMFDTVVRRLPDGRSYPLYVIPIGSENGSFVPLQKDFIPVDLDLQSSTAFKIDVTADVAADYKATIAFNGHEVVKSRQLPAGNPVAFIVQAFRLSSLADVTDPVSVEIESLKISGNLP